MSGRDAVINGVVSYWAPLISRYLSAYHTGHDTDVDDIRSDLWVICLSRAAEHDAAISTLRTYLSGACQGHLQHLLRDLKLHRGRYVYFDDVCGRGRPSDSDDSDNRTHSADAMAATDDAQAYLLAASSLLSAAASLGRADRAVAAALVAAPDATQAELADDIGMSQFTVSTSLRRIRSAARDLAVA